MENTSSTRRGRRARGKVADRYCGMKHAMTITSNTKTCRCRLDRERMSSRLKLLGGAMRFTSLRMRCTRAG
jgi:hypothetical protein